MSRMDFPKEVRTQIERLTEGFRTLLAENLVGVYLHGSLATGCFNPLRSDVDLLVVTRARTGLGTKRELGRFLLDNSRRPSPVEISFLAAGDLRPWRHPTPFDLHYSEDWREKYERELAGGARERWDDAGRFDADLAAHVTVLNHHGVCLYGRAVPDVFPTVPERDFLDSILGDVLGEEFGVRGAVLKYPVYVVLNSCRTLAFLRGAGVMSKAEGGRWALENLPARFRPVIEGALNEYWNSSNESGLPEKPLADFAVFMEGELLRRAAAARPETAG